MSTSYPPRRKFFSFISSFHRWFFIQMSIYAVSFIALIAFSVYSWVHYFIHRIIEVVPSLTPEGVSVLESSVNSSLLLGLTFLLLLIAIALLSFIQFSRKVAGPLYAISRDVGKMGESGTTFPIRLRQGDLFVEMVDQLNALNGHGQVTHAKE